MDKNTNNAKIEVSVSFMSLVKIAATLLLFYATYELRDLLLLLVASAYIALALNFLQAKLEAMGQSRIFALSATVGSFLFIVISSVLLIVPRLTEQLSVIVKAFPQMKQSLLENIPTQLGLRGSVERAFEHRSLIDGGIEKIWDVGLVLFGGVSALVLFLIFSIYLLIEGEAIFNWILVFFSKKNQARIKRSQKEITAVIYSYVSGQLITSCLAGVFAFVVATIFGVPAPTLIGVLVAILDALPLVGFAISTFIAGCLALTVSSAACVGLVICYGCYHLIEIYFILPKVYGSGLKVSSLVVLLALFVGATFGGVLGALIVLPLVASYTSIEKIWLAQQVGPEVIREHAVDNNSLTAARTGT